MDLVRINETSVQEFAMASGVQSVGWIPGGEFTGYLREIESRPEYDFHYRSHEKFKHAATPPPFARTLVVLLVDFFLAPPAAAEGFRISNYSRACWHNVGMAADKVIGYLRARGWRAEMVDVPARAAAVKAGLGVIGKNTLFYAHGMGSYVGIGVIGTDLELPRRPGNPDESAGLKGKIGRLAARMRNLPELLPHEPGCHA